MRIYRIENTEGKGPYNGSLTLEAKEVLFTLCDRGGHHSPMYYGAKGQRINLWEEHNHMQCGFTSLGKLLDWFWSTEVLQRLRDNGYFVAIYDCPRWAVLVQSDQVAFDKQKAKFLEMINL